MTVVKEQHMAALLSVLTDQGGMEPLEPAHVERTRINGWPLYHLTPDRRLKNARRLMTQYPNYIVVLLRHTAEPDQCTKFLVSRELTLEQFQQQVAVALQDTRAFHLVFDGKAFPASNTMGSIFNVQSRDDATLHGFMAPLDVASNMLLCTSLSHGPKTM